MNGQERLSPMHEVLGLAHRFGQHIWMDWESASAPDSAVVPEFSSPFWTAMVSVVGATMPADPAPASCPSGVDDVRAPIIHSNPRIVS